MHIKWEAINTLSVKITINKHLTKSITFLWMCLWLTDTLFFLSVIDEGLQDIQMDDIGKLTCYMVNVLIVNAKKWEYLAFPCKLNQYYM